MSEPENEPKSARADVAREAIERLKGRYKLGPDDQVALDKAIELLTSEAVAAALASNNATLEPQTGDQDLSTRALKFMIAMLRWQQEHLDLLMQGVLTIGGKTVLSQQVDVAVARLAREAHRTDGSEFERLEVLRKAVFKLLEAYRAERAPAEAQPATEGGADSNAAAMARAAQELLRVLSLADGISEG